MSENEKLAREWFDLKFNVHACQYPCTYCGDQPDPEESEHEDNVKSLAALLDHVAEEASLDCPIDRRDAEWEHAIRETCKNWSWTKKDICDLWDVWAEILKRMEKKI
jgi:hypothetical protein